MREGSLRTFDRPADRIRQHRQASEAPILLVEGPDDVRVLRPHVPDAQFFPLAGKNCVVDTARSLMGGGDTDFVCVTDSDFDDTDKYADLISVHHPYDGTDLESMLVELGVLAQVLEHQGSPSKIADHGGVNLVVECAKQEARRVAALRLMNAQESLFLRFDAVDVTSKVKRNTLELDRVGYCTALEAASDTMASIGELLRAVNEPIRDQRYCGKDAIAIAGVALRSLIGSLQHAACAPTVLIAQVHSSAGLAVSRSPWLAALTTLITSKRSVT